MNRTTVRLAVIGSLGLAALLLGACGGDDAAPTTVAPDATAPNEEPSDTQSPDTQSSDTAADGTTGAGDGGDGDSTDPTAAADDAAASADAAVTDTTAANTAGDEDDGGGESIDGSDIDWATVDLTTIDWQNIDMTTVDVDALPLNPTVGNLSDETIALVQERFAEVGTGGGADPNSADGSGTATLTIGTETWDFDGFICAFGYANTQSDVFSFSSNAFGELSDGTRTQLQANVWDDTGADALTGPDTDHEITFDDIDNFDDPAVDWLMTGTELAIDGSRVSAEGTFRDAGTGEEQPGSFAGECGPGSRF